MRLNFRGTEISTAKPMVVGCVQLYSIHFVNKLGKSLRVENGKKWPKMPILAKSAIFTKKGPRYLRAPMDA